MEQLAPEELTNLLKSVFPPFPGDKKLGILVDIPANPRDDNEDWQSRRKMAAGWFEVLRDKAEAVGLEEVKLVAYGDIGSNNADLPGTAFFIGEKLPPSADRLKEAGEAVPFDTVFQECQLFLAPTEYSTTAPLKNAARLHGFRAATMPGFSPKMIPALKIDYNEVYRRVRIMKEKVDAAILSRVDFTVDTQKEYRMFFDLRFREGHLSPGRFPDKGVAGNLPSGETYIVPYEGERGIGSKTRGILPVQIEDQVALFTVEENRAVSVSGLQEPAVSPPIQREIDHLMREPAYGNMAELGFGVLGDFGLEPINEILLDEKLGFHVAFGRSDHFGGIVGPADFSSPQEVVHLDRVYIPAMQPRILVKSLILGFDTGEEEEIIREGKYLVF